jgi:glycine reductase
VHHGGYDTRFVNADANRLVPLDAVRELEREGAFGKLHETIHSTAGLGMSLSNARKLGREIGTRLKNHGVDAVILTSTCGTSTRCGAALAKEIERMGIATAQVCSMQQVAATVGSPRIVRGASVLHPTGDPDLAGSEERALRRRIVESALQALISSSTDAA